MKNIRRDKTYTARGLFIIALVALLIIPATTAMGAKPVDGDGDGFTNREDCNDTDSSIYPGAVEICGDGIDNNCDGIVDEGCGGGGIVDLDGDGFLDATRRGRHHPAVGLGTG